MKRNISAKGDKRKVLLDSAKSNNNKSEKKSLKKSLTKMTD